MLKITTAMFFDRGKIKPNKAMFQADGFWDVHEGKQDNEQINQLDKQGKKKTSIFFFPEKFFQY